MANEITIPALPCVSVNDTLNFYVALGFEITYQQTRPNIYGCVKRGDIDLHFFAMKGIDPANSYSTCLVLIPDANALYQSFTQSLRQYYGKLPVAGIPRITKPSNKNAAGDYRFNVVDPGGNYIRFIQQSGHSNQPEMPKSENTALTKFGRAVRSADLLVNGPVDFPAAAKVLDKALTGNRTDETSTELLKAYLLRAEIAVNMDDLPLAKTFLADISQLALTDAERSSLDEEFQKIEDLALMLDSPKNDFF